MVPKLTPETIQFDPQLDTQLLLDIRKKNATANNIQTGAASPLRFV